MTCCSAACRSRRVCCGSGGRLRLERLARRCAAERLHDALRHQEECQTSERQRQEDVEQAPREVHPEVADRPSVSRRTKPRASATATAMPVAAERKFWTVSAAIWVRWLIVVSPA